MPPTVGTQADRDDRVVADARELHIGDRRQRVEQRVRRLHVCECLDDQLVGQQPVREPQAPVLLGEQQPQLQLLDQLARSAGQLLGHRHLPQLSERERPPAGDRGGQPDAAQPSPRVVKRDIGSSSSIDEVIQTLHDRGLTLRGS